MLRAASVRTQLLALFGLAVLPAMALSAVFTWQSYRTIKLTTENFQRLAASGLATQVSNDLAGLNILGHALLGAMGGDDASDCASLRTQTQPGKDGRVAAYGYFRNGILVCSAGEQGAVSAFPAETMRAPPPAASQTSPHHAITSKTGPPRLAVASFGPGGRTLLTVLSATHMEAKLVDSWMRGGFFIMIDSRNQPLAGVPDNRAAGWLPRDPGVFSAAHDRLTTSVARNGKRLTYAAVTAAPGAVHIFSGMKEVRFGNAEQQLALGLAAPLLIFAIVMGVTWLAIDRLFLQWMRRLSKTAIRLSYGDFNVRAALPASAPRELRQFARAFDQMTEVLAARTRELATVANQRSALLKELHHRVKNNFQVIASFLSLSKRQSSGEAYRALALSECRVHAMATAYKQALSEGDISNAALAPLVTEVLSYVEQCADVQESAICRMLDAGSQSDCYLELDRAIPMALLLVEVLWPLLSLNEETGGPRARLEFRRKGDTVTLRIWDISQPAAGRPGEPAASDRPGDARARRLSGRMRQAFITQLEASQAPPAAGGASTDNSGAPLVLSISIPVLGHRHVT